MDHISATQYLCSTCWSSFTFILTRCIKKLPKKKIDAKFFRKIFQVQFFLGKKAFVSFDSKSSEAYFKPKKLIWSFFGKGRGAVGVVSTCVNKIAPEVAFLAGQPTWPAKPVMWMVQLPRREERLRSRPIPPMWEGGVLKLRARSLGKAGPSLPAYVAIEACFMEWCNHPDGEEMGLAPPCSHTAGQARLKVRQSRPKSTKG